MKNFIERLAIIGVGLIGGSLARDLKRLGKCNEIIGCGRNIDNLEKAIELGVIDSYTTNPAQAVIDADMIIIAVPLGAIGNILSKIKPSLPPDAIITDVGSAKSSVVVNAREHLENIENFIPAHPIAGAENSGVTASKDNLFVNRRVILTPLAENKIQAVEKVKQMWFFTGAEVLKMSVSQHDEVLAATSHLPHMLAYTLVDMLANMETHQEIFRFAAGGFRDFTRIAASDPTMWHDICVSNKDMILKMLLAYQEHLKLLTNAIETDNSLEVEDLFKRAKIARDSYSES
jgi:prephenate dehydrogenase